MAEILETSYQDERDEEATAECRYAFVSAAIDVLERGEIALEDHPDPYGQGRFNYTSFDGGFLLGSKLVYGDLEVEMEIGLRSRWPKSWRRRIRMNATKKQLPNAAMHLSPPPLMSSSVAKSPWRIILTHTDRAGSTTRPSMVAFY